jgi:SNF2 family DNA or RNA helicase
MQPLGSDDDDDADANIHPGLQRKLSKRRRQQVKSAGSDTLVPAQRCKSMDASPGLSPAKLSPSKGAESQRALSDDANESGDTFDSDDNDDSPALVSTPHRLLPQLSATERLKRVDKEVRPQFAASTSESQSLDLWPGLPGRDVDFSQRRPPSHDGTPDELVPWPWMHLQRVAVTVPDVINRYLRSYQREGVSVMAQSLLHGQGHLLADDMGLGKTVQVRPWKWRHACIHAVCGCSLAASTPRPFQPLLL